MAFFPCYCLLTIQNTPSNLKQLFSWFNIVTLFILFVSFTLNKGNVVQKLFHGIENFFSTILLILLVEPRFSSSEVQSKTESEESNSRNEQCCSDQNKGDWNIHRGDVEIVMKNLGFTCNQEGEELKELMSSDGISLMFQEKEPSLEEVKGAFDVFDENKDGFIDAMELQRVLGLLGLKEGFDLENCRIMIRAFDQNGDYRIDINEFIRFMETSFC